MVSYDYKMDYDDNCGVVIKENRCRYGAAISQARANAGAARSVYLPKQFQPTFGTNYWKKTPPSVY